MLSGARSPDASHAGERHEAAEQSCMEENCGFSNFSRKDSKVVATDRDPSDLLPKPSLSPQAQQLQPGGNRLL